MSPADKRRNSRKPKRTAGQQQKIWNQQQRKRRRELGQNFLKDERVAETMVRESGVTNIDLVVELGAGSGMLTRPLSKIARKLISVEYDPLWAAHLKQDFLANKNVEIVAADALCVDFPEEPFTVVSNIPFHLSTAILHRLLDDPEQSPELVHLLVQRELARKHARTSPTTLKTLSWSPWWRFDLGLQVPAGAFDPKPEVGACLLVAAKRGAPLVAYEHRELFRAFVEAIWHGRGNAVGKRLRPVFTKNQIRRLARDNGFSTDCFPSQLTVQQWAAVFEFMVRAVPQSRWPMPESAAKRGFGRAGHGCKRRLPTLPERMSVL